MGRGRKGGFGEGRRLDKKEGVAREEQGLEEDIVGGTGRGGQEEEGGGILEIVEIGRQGSWLDGEVGQE